MKVSLLYHYLLQYLYRYIHGPWMFRALCVTFASIRSSPRVAGPLNDTLLNHLLVPCQCRKLIFFLAVCIWKSQKPIPKIYTCSKKKIFGQIYVNILMKIHRIALLILSLYNFIPSEFCLTVFRCPREFAHAFFTAFLSAGFHAFFFRSLVFPPFLLCG